MVYLMPMGSYIGKPVKELRISHIFWLLSQDRLIKSRPDLARALLGEVRRRVHMDFPGMEAALTPTDDGPQDGSDLV